MRPDVSVLMPAHNVEAFIGDAIESCLRQTVENLELIVVDDGSIDGTVSVVEGFRDPRVRFFRLPTNTGQAQARNATLDAATGTWIAPLDADDLWEATRLEELLTIGTRLGDQSVVFDISQPFVVDRRGRNRPLARPRPPNQGGEAPVELDPIDFVKEGRAGHPLFSSALVQATHARYPVGVDVAVDTAFYVQLLNADSARVFRVMRPLYHYRVRPGSVTGSADRIQQVRRAYEFLFEACSLRPEMEEAVRFRLALLDIEFEYECLLKSLRTAQWRQAAQLLGADSRLAGLLARRAKRSLGYRMRLAAWGSEGRK